MLFKEELWLKAREGKVQHFFLEVKVLDTRASNSNSGTTWCCRLKVVLRVVSVPDPLFSPTTGLVVGAVRDLSFPWIAGPMVVLVCDRYFPRIVGPVVVLVSARPGFIFWVYLMGRWCG